MKKNSSLPRQILSIQGVVMFSFFLFFVSSAFSQSMPSVSWQRVLGGSRDDYAFTIVPTSDGGFVLGSNVRSSDGDISGSHGERELWVVKFDGAKNIVWQRALGGTKNDRGTLVKPTADGGFIVAGTASSNNGDLTQRLYKGGESDMWVVKLTSSGAISWQRTFGGSGKDELIAIEEVPGGGYIVSGNTSSVDGDSQGNHGMQDMWAGRISATGNLVWKRVIGGSGFEHLTDMLLAPNGNVVLAGVTRSPVSGDISTSYGEQDFWVGILNSSGNLFWKKTIGGSLYEVRLALALSVDGSYFYFSGAGESSDFEFSGSHGDLDAIVYKFALNGNLIWRRLVGGSGREIVYTMQSTNDGGCILGGVSTSFNGDLIRTTGGMFVAKLRGDGVVQWANRYGGSINEELYALDQVRDGGYIISGVVQSNGGDIKDWHQGKEGWEGDTWIARLDPSGTLIWSRCFGGSGQDWSLAAYSLHSPLANLQPLTDNKMQQENGYYYFVLTTNSTDGDVSGVHLPKRSKTSYVPTDIWLVQLYPDDVSNRISVPLSSPAFGPDALSVYPNPFADQLTIGFYAWETAKAEISLFDLSGRKIRTLWSGTLEKEERFMRTFNDPGLPVGSYILVISNGSRKEIRRLVKPE